MRELLADACGTLVLDEETGVVRFTRSETPYASNAHLASLHAQIGRVCDRLGRERHTLLVDMRRAPLNNDPSFEQAAVRARAILVRGFPRVAVLVQTAVGSLQVKRHIRQDGLTIAVLQNDADAILYLTAPEGAEAAPPSSTGGAARRSERR
jgi:hypothetical protein